MTLFAYIEDKDVFRDMYGRRMSLRLVHSLSVSRDDEVYLVSAMKDACGGEYTISLERMLADLVISTDLTSQFNEKMEDEHRVELTAMVLTSTVWALAVPGENPVVPKELSRTQEDFVRFYQQKHA